MRAKVDEFKAKSEQQATIEQLKADYQAAFKVVVEKALAHEEAIGLERSTRREMKEAKRMANDAKDRMLTAIRDEAAASLYPAR